ncbi:MAG TPA: glucokinase [Geminicoccaceae bacterium]|nr:glucokinase [Geminicoccaceae bacterium]
MRRLIGDIGGTNARFALVEDGGQPTAERVLAVADHPGLVEAALAYLGGERVEEAVLAVATPVETDAVRFTNSPWAFRVSELPAALGVARVSVINDFVAQALAIPHLDAGDVERLHHGEPLADRPIGVIGPGTGLGVSALIPLRGRWIALPTEGGHVSFAPGSARERAVLEHLSGTLPHVSNERLISGPGLYALARALAELDGAALGPTTPAGVARAAGDGSSAHAAEAVRMFSALLGAAAGDLALVYGARGGIYIGGGVCHNLGPLFDRAAFRERFLAKGRMRTFLDPIPVYLVGRTDTGLLGAARQVIEH